MLGASVGENDVGEARRNPRIVPVRFRDIIRPEHYDKFRWQFFRVHFQFVMANERPNIYDFYMIACGPVPLRERMSEPDAALSIAIGDPERRAQKEEDGALVARHENNLTDTTDVSARPQFAGRRLPLVFGGRRR